MIILDGKKIANEETSILKKQVSNLENKLKLGIIQVGDNNESNKYIKNKINKANEIGIISNNIKLSPKISENELIQKVKEIQNEYDGIIVQLPLPDHINSQKVLDAINLDKDVDGLSTNNMNNFYSNKKPYYCPATARAIHLLLTHYDIDLNKKIMVIGESNLVGKPIKKILAKYANYIESRNKKTGIKGSNDFDILIVAAGSPNLIKEKDVKENSVIIDVGINIINNKIVGDVDFESVKNKVKAISPVPGGIGPLTVICLLKNLVEKHISK